MTADEQRPDDTPMYRSPKRSLALSFRLSRDRWKAKATLRLQQIKTWRVRSRDLQASRDLWKQKALHLQEQLHQLQQAAAADTPLAAATTAPPTAAAIASLDPAPHQDTPDPQIFLGAAAAQTNRATPPAPEVAEVKKKRPPSRR